MNERLLEIKKMCDKGYYSLADGEIDKAYEDWVNGDLKLTEEEEEYMFFLMDKIMWKVIVPHL